MNKLKALLTFDYYYENIWRIVFAMSFLLIPFLGGAETKEAFFGSISDAYLQVSVFVALTLLIFYGLETWLKLDTGALLKKHRKYQVPLSALMGALPGCGGAIMVMTQYSMGRLGFGGVVAVLTSTMGDAAFLLLAQKPFDALVVFGISISVGIIFGYLVEWIHGYDFLRKKSGKIDGDFGTLFEYKKLKTPWILLLVPGFVVAMFIAFQSVEVVDEFVGELGMADFSLWLGVVGAAVTVLMWLVNPLAGTVGSQSFSCKTAGDVWDKVVADTAFVTTWVVLGYLMFELGVLWTGVDLASLFKNVQPVLPLIAIFIGFLPGCGPQVLVTSLYVQGLIPFSAQLGNAISNDGDALFPAIAMSPKVAVLATLYTAVPALIVGYGWYFLFEI